ncbi:MAG: hypothetical protein IPG84_12205 [Betaproteobacteria bacterium]|nr:hypothetical protein [Betaproteobacteria bacterium]
MTCRAPSAGSTRGWLQAIDERRGRASPAASHSGVHSVGGAGRLARSLPFNTGHGDIDAQRFLARSRYPHRGRTSAHLRDRAGGAKAHPLIPAGSYANTQFIRPWCDKIPQESADKLKSRIYPPMQIDGTPPHQFEQIEDGVAGVIGTLPGYTAGRFPLTEVFELPFMMQNQDAEATSKALWDYLQQHDTAGFKDVHPIAFQVHGHGVFHIATSRSRRSTTRRARALPSRSSKARLSIAQLVCQSRREGIDLSRRQVPMRVLRVRPPPRTPD